MTVRTAVIQRKQNSFCS